MCLSQICTHMQHVFMCIQKLKFIAIIVSREMCLVLPFSKTLIFQSESYSRQSYFPLNIPLNSENVTFKKLKIMVKYNKQLPEYIPNILILN